jgi:SPP1 gp7 family putative phage head morphogenesis protein
MTIGPETLRLADRRTATLTRIADESTRTLVRGYTAAWDQTAGDLQAAIAQALASLEQGDRLTWRQLDRIERFGAALRRLGGQLDDLAAAGRVTISDGAGRAVQVASEFDPAIIASQLPNVGPSTTQLAQALGGNVAGGSFDAIVARAQQRIVSSLQPLAPDAMAAMRRELVRGITLGRNPNATATAMLDRLQSRFAGGLVRAIRIARTEQLDAYRQASAVVADANSDVLQEAVWTAKLDDRTCPACLSMHGQPFPVGTAGPEGHVQCRCAFILRTKPWQDLGFGDVPEPPDALPDRDGWWQQQPDDVRRQIMGPSRLQALESGDIGWDDLARRVQHDGWRDAFELVPLRDLGVEPLAAAVV